MPRNADEGEEYTEEVVYRKRRKTKAELQSDTLQQPRLTIPVLSNTASPFPPTTLVPLERPITPPLVPPRDDEHIISPHGSRWLEAQMHENPINIGLNVWADLQSTAGTIGEVEDDIWRQIEQDENDWTSETHPEGNDWTSAIQPEGVDDWRSETVRESHYSPSTMLPDTNSIPRSSKKVQFSEQPDSSSEGDDSVDSLEPHAPPALRSFDDETFGVPTRRSAEPMSDFILGFAMWCESKGVTRREYAALRDVLCLSNISDIEKLPSRLSTLLTWGRTRLPIPSLYKAKVPVLVKKQPTNTAGKTAALYFMDVRVLVSMLLSTRDAARHTHFGMADIVESPTELWHADCWGASIRTCGSDFARYQWNQSPIFPSDFVRYQESDGNLSLGRVIFFGRDRRQQSATINQVVIKVQKVWRNQDNSGYILSEDNIVELLESHIIAQESIAIGRQKRSQHIPSSQLVHHILTRSKIRPVSKLKPVRAELELEHFGRQHLTNMLYSGVVSFPFTCFIDDFGLYRNMYRSLCGVYLTPAGLSIEERQRTYNVYPITLGPHGARLNDVIYAIQESIQALEQGCKIMVNGQEKIVWSPILAYIGDMKGQQEAAGFMGARAEHCCRMCNCDGQNRDNMDLDLDLLERNHYETEALRQEATTLPSIQRRKFFSLHGLLPEPSALQTMTPALDLMRSRPGDPAHSEFSGIVRRIMPVLCENILTPKALTSFSERLRSFQFPPGWGRIQSPETHMKSWTMSECARASVVVPVLLRCWPLTNFHIRSEYREALKTHCAELINLYTAAEIVIINLGKIAKSNSLVATTCLSLEDRRLFQEHVLDGRRAFQALMNASKFKRKKPRKAAKPTAKQAPTNTRRRTAGYTSSQQSMSDDGSVADSASQSVDGISQGPEQPVSLEDKMAALPNVHVALHFPALTQEYGLLWNVNALPGERMHKFFKAAVLATNHRKVERQLLLKSCIQITVRLALRGAFQTTDPELSTAISTLKERCPHLFEDLVQQEADSSGSLESRREDDVEFIGSLSHIKPLVHDRIREYQARALGLPVRMTDDTSSPFFTQLRTAMISYGHRSSSLGSKALKWFQQVSFFDPISTRRISLRKGNYITLCGERFCLAEKQYARIEWIFLHCFPRGDEQRIFAMVTLVGSKGEQDWLLNLPVLRTGQSTIISLLEIAPARTWMVPVITEGEMGDGDALLKCEWDVNFS